MRIHMYRSDKLERTNNIMVHIETVSKKVLAIEKELDQIERLQLEEGCWDLKNIRREVENLRAVIKRLSDGVNELVRS
jgi:archaellum component FlaC